MIGRARASKPQAAAAVAIPAALLAALAVGQATAAPALTPGTLPPAPYRQLARELLHEMIAVDTTHAKGSTRAAEQLRDRVLAAGFAPADVTVIAPPDHPAKGNVIIRYRGIGGGAPVLFLGHLDVVEADRRAWVTDPFQLVEQNGYFVARGTEDMKAENAVLLAALIRLKQEGYTPANDIIVAFTADEEAGGDANGPKFLFAQHRALVNAGLAISVDGGGGHIIDGRRAFIGAETSEKLYVTYELFTQNRGGHSSLPRRDNAINQLVAALGRIAAYRFPVHITPTTRALFLALADLKTGQLHDDLIAVAQPVPDAAAAERLSDDPLSNARLRTTCVATMVDGGNSESSLPNRAHAVIQCRLMPGETPEQTAATLTRVIADPGVRLVTDGPIDPSPETVPDEAVLGRIRQAADRVWQGVKIIPEMEPGASDCVYTRGAGIPSYDVPLIFIEDSRAHGRDERVPVQTFDEAGEFAYQMLRVFSK